MPEELKPLVKRGFSICPWDGLDAAARRKRAECYDSLHDPNQEYSAYYAVAEFYRYAEENEKKTHDEKNHTENFIWRDVLDRLNNIFDIDRDRAGAEIQELKRKVSDNEKLESEVTKLRLENAELKNNQSIPEQSADRHIHDSELQALSNENAESGWTNLSPPGNSGEFASLCYQVANSLGGVPVRAELARELVRRFGESHNITAMNCKGHSLVYDGKNYSHDALNKVIARMKAQINKADRDM